jgi:hypothetical protein
VVFRAFLVTIIFPNLDLYGHCKLSKVAMAIAFCAGNIPAKLLAQDSSGTKNSR